MTTHKIPNVDKAICTAEQKIAYNLSFAHYDIYRKKFLSLPTESAKTEALCMIRDKMIKLWKAGYDYKEGRYDTDAVFCALNGGLRQYIEKPFIASNYEQIGECFKIGMEV